MGERAQPGLGAGARAAFAALRERFELDGTQARAQVMSVLVSSLAEARGLPCPALGPGWDVDDEPRACVREHLPPASSLASLACEQIGVVYEQLLELDARKGSGSFYSPEALTMPTVRETLAPLLRDADGRLRPPEHLLTLRVCDPAMGAGNFLLAALRCLAEAVDASLREHAGTLARSARAAVAEQCLYGVDLDAQAVALARAALWIEAGDPNLPITALAQHLRRGDALVGVWPTQSRDYPLRALERELKDARLRRARKAAKPRIAASPEAPLTQAGCDAWCALWFWPPAALDVLPLPGQLHDLDPAAAAVIAALTAERQFMHWSLVFPEVFGPGFDAVIGNPPWDIRKPNSKEFFAAHDPEYRNYGKQRALTAQQRLFAGAPALADRWRAHCREFDDLAHFVRHAAAHDRPFRHQGSADLNSYKLFCELALALLREGGQLGLIVPSGIYTDKGSQTLREYLLEACQWRWVYGFENRDKLFDIDGRFKFCVLIAGRSGHTETISTAFMRRDLLDWHEQRAAVVYPAARVRALSPTSVSLLEIRTARDLEVLATIHANAVLLGERGPHAWDIEHTTEFHMTSDSHLFIGREQAEARGYVPEPCGHWRDASGHTLVPLYEGRMIGQFDFAEKAWVSGKGRAAVWRELDWPDKRIAPQWLMASDDWQAWRAAAGPQRPTGPKLVFMAIGSASNRRSMFAALVPDVPCGNAVPLLRPRGGLPAALALAATLNSFVYDFALRARLGGLNLNVFIMAETALLRPQDVLDELTGVAARLCLGHAVFADSWPALGEPTPHWAVTPAERLRLRCMLDAIVAVLYGLSRADVSWILQDCDHPSTRLAEPGFARQLDAKGFWRLDKSAPPELRHAVLSLVAFDDLQAEIAAARDRDAGIRRFVRAWQLPEQVCIAALGLHRSVDAGDYDERARLDQPVRARLG